MFDLNEALLRLPASVRQDIRQGIFHRVVPNLADSEKLERNELITDPGRQGAALDAEIAILREQVAAGA